MFPDFHKKKMRVLTPALFTFTLNKHTDEGIFHTSVMGFCLIYYDIHIIQGSLTPCELSKHRRSVLNKLSKVGSGAFY